MSTVSIQKSIMERYIANMQNVINKKYSSAFDITTHIMIETIENNLVLKATDYELYLKITTPILQESKIKCAVNGESINNILKTLNDDDLTIKQEQDTINIKQNRTSFKIPIIDIREFPFDKNYKEMEKIDIDSRKLTGSVKKILHCCSEKDNNLASQGVCIESKDGELNIVATDTKRLGFMRERNKNNKNFSFVIPKKAILEAIRIFSDDFEIYIRRHEKGVDTICMTNETHEFYAKTLELKFPDYRKLIEKMPKNQPVTVKKERLLKSINQINSISQRSKISFSANGMRIEAMDGINGATASVELDNIEVPLPKDLIIAFTNKHLLEYLSTTKSEDIEILIEDTNAAVFFRSNDLEEVIMPRIL